MWNTMGQTYQGVPSPFLKADLRGAVPAQQIITSGPDVYPDYNEYNQMSIRFLDAGTLTGDASLKITVTSSMRFGGVSAASVLITPLSYQWQNRRFSYTPGVYDNGVVTASRGWHEFTFEWDGRDTADRSRLLIDDSLVSYGVANAAGNSLLGNLFITATAAGGNAIGGFDDVYFRGEIDYLTPSKTYQFSDLDDWTANDETTFTIVSSINASGSTPAPLAPLTMSSLDCSLMQGWIVRTEITCFPVLG
jgi:hypothetical protein